MKKIKAYGSRNCSFCVMLQPILLKLKDQSSIDIEFYELHENRKLFYNLGIIKYPTLIFFNEDGQEYKRTEGLLSEEEILEIYKNNI
jgi:thioredoxin 1